MKIGILFGGSGYIGFFLSQILLENSFFDKLIIYDIKKPVAYLKTPRLDKIDYVNGDVRQPIDIPKIEGLDIKNSWIFNLAAVHREPGHDYHEYFDTNIKGANQINSFAEESGILNLLFTSSIAPYGKSHVQKTEKSELYPETAYGISKGMAELIHQKWLKKSGERRLIIVRPSVIFGPKDPGNVYRMISSLKKGTFVLPNGGNIVKAYGYVYGLVESMIFTMQKEDSFILYNYAENPLVKLKEMVSIVKKEFNYTKPTLSLSVNLLSIAAFFLQLVYKITGRKTDIHPVRVKKAGFPTNIKPEYLIENGFNFKYDFQSSLSHWKRISPEDF